MKATEPYFPVVLFIVLSKVVLTFKFVPYWKSLSETIQMKAIEQHFAVVAFYFSVFNEWNLEYGRLNY